MDDALALARAGSASLLVDALWSTNAPGKPSYDTAMTIEQVIDLRRDLDALLAQPGVDSTRIAYVGHEFRRMYGCILLAVDHRRLWRPHDSDQPLERLGSAHQPAERRRTGRLHPAHGHLRPSMNLPHTQLRGLYLQFAQQDIYVSQADAQYVSAAAPAPKETLVYPTDHALAVPQATQDRLKWLSGN